MRAAGAPRGARRRAPLHARGARRARSVRPRTLADGLLNLLVPAGAGGRGRGRGEVRRAPAPGGLGGGGSDVGGAKRTAPRWRTARARARHARGAPCCRRVGGATGSVARARASAGRRGGRSRSAARARGARAREPGAGECACSGKSHAPAARLHNLGRARVRCSTRGLSMMFRPVGRSEGATRVMDPPLGRETARWRVGEGGWARGWPPAGRAPARQPGGEAAPGGRAARGMHGATRPMRLCTAQMAFPPLPPSGAPPAS